MSDATTQPPADVRERMEEARATVEAAALAQAARAARRGEGGGE